MFSLFVVCGILAPVIAFAASTYVWTEHSSSPGASFEWGISGSGTALAAVSEGGDVWTSPDGGTTWFDRAGAGSRGWKGVATFNNGVGIVAGALASDLFVSTSSGATWQDISATGAHAWMSVGASSDGSVMAAVAANDDIYVSTTTGATWTNMTSGSPLHGLNWFLTAVSANGSTIIAVNGTGQVYISTTTGATWTAQTAVGSHSWTGAAVNANGSKIMVSAINDHIYITTNGGNTWAAASGVPASAWASATMSSDGNTLVGAIGDGNIWTSIDGGATWVDNTSPGNQEWSSLAILGDNTTIAAGTFNTNIWTAILQRQNDPAPSPPSPSGGGGLPWCSGPNAPGWSVSLPGGGCSVSNSTPGAPILPMMTPATSSVSIKNYSFTRDLHIRMSGPDVLVLQQFLNTHGFYISASGFGSVGNESTYFGQATKAALIAFQNANNLSPARGYFGSKTRAIFNLLK